MLDFELSFETDAPDAARVPFSGSLGVAAFNGQVAPDQQAFASVDGFNLSHTGISFTTALWPANDRLMVALGDDRSPVMVSARVVACTKRDNEDGAVCYEVRCEFDQWHT